MSGKWLNYAAEICAGKEEDSNYIRFVKDFDAKKGNNMIMVGFEDYLQGMVDKEFMSEEEMKTKLEKTPWVKYVLHLPPQDTEEEDAYEIKNGWVNGALEMCESKKGNLYIKICRTFTADKDHTAQLTSFEDSLHQLMSKGFIDQEVFDKRMKSMGSWKHYTVSIGPKKEAA